MDAAVKEIARGGDTASAANAARQVAQSLGAVVKPGAGQPLVCRLCGSTPAANVTLHEHNGRIAWMVHKTNQGPFCRDCGIALFRHHQNSTMFQGWFGFISFFLTPVTMLLNLTAWLRLRSLPAPRRDANVSSRIPAALNPGKPLLSRAGPYVAMIIVALVTGFFIGPAVPTLRQKSTGSAQVAPPAPSASVSSSLAASPVPQAGPFPPTGSAYSYTSAAAGDFIGQGKAETLTPPAWRFGAGLVNGPDEVGVGASSGLIWWTITMAAPRGQSLHVGTYDNAMSAPVRQGNQPGLDVSGDGRACDNVFGTFTITRLDVDTYGKVTAFEATFVQHCDRETAPPLSGHVRFVLTPDTTAQPPSDSAPMGPFPPSGDAYSFTSESGDYIGQGKAQTVAPPGWSFNNRSGTAGSGWVSINIDTTSSNTPVFWTVTVAAPTGQALHVGTYGNAMRAALRQGDQPGLDVSGDGRGCNQVFGTFTVTKIQYGSAGQLTAFEAVFVQHCESPSSPELYGRIRYVAAS